MNDETLIDLTLSGDKEAFGTLARKYQDRVYNLALPIVGNSEDAMDVVQETFLQALSHLDGFRRSSRFYTWLYRIAYNCAIGALRRRRTASFDQIVEATGERFVASEAAPDADAKLADDVRILREEISKLPEEFRAALVLREMEGANYDEIAETLKIPIGTVRSRLHRARQALREAFERRRDD